jgi:ATP-dependent helicase HepA
LGRVVRVEGRRLEVHFPGPDTTLRLAVDADALEPFVLRPGMRVRAAGSTRVETVEAVSAAGLASLASGREVDVGTLWPLADDAELLDRLVAGEVDSQEAFALRLDALRLAAIREADGLGSFLGGRVRLFPHQLYVAERATRERPVRWLLADEVGLGKTVEACLILNHLLATRDAESALVVAPETLTVQWLGELWRKYHQVFVLLDEARLDDVAKDFGADFNPFITHRRAVIAQELLERRPELATQAAAAGVDVLIVDEAHHLRRPEGHPGNPAYRAVAPLAAAARHLLLLTAVPLEDDAHGFFRLLELLRPDDYADFADFSARLSRGERLPPRTSATRRVDIGGLPPRLGVAVELAHDAGWAAQEALHRAVASLPPGDAVSRSHQLRHLRRALAYPGALRTSALDGTLPALRSPEIQTLVAAAERLEPRVEWLVGQARQWVVAGEKVLVFVAERDAAEALRQALGRHGGARTAVFHEQLSTRQRDIEVAQFRSPDGPAILVSTECGGEGRNFEFCTRLVLFDLPWSPLVAEQRVGRLDRIGRRLPVEVAYFRPPRGIGRVVVDLYERLGLFREPLSSYESELSRVESAIEERAVSAVLADRLDSAAEPFAEILAEIGAAYDRVQRAAFHELHRDPYRPELAAGILARIPPELETLTREVVLGAASELGLHVAERRGGVRGGQRYAIEIGAGARVESLPGLAGEHSFLGTFDREEAVADEGIDFYATGHALVEGVLAQLDEEPLGRVALLSAAGPRGGFGLLGVYRDGPGWRAVAVDGKGRERPDWATLFSQRGTPLRRVRADEWLSRPAWPRLIRSLGAALERHGRPLALAAIRVAEQRPASIP